MSIGSLDIFPKTGTGDINSLGGFPLTAAHGGTGRTSLPPHGILIGEGTSPLNSIPLTDGQLLIGSSGNDPLPNTITAGAGISIVNGPGTITISSSASANAFSTNSGTAAPALGTLNIVGSGIITTSGSGNTVTIQSTGGGLGWTDATASMIMISNEGYIADSGVLVTLTLPASPALGDIIRVAGFGSGGWKIAQNASQTIRFGSLSTTVGVAGFLQSTKQNDCVELVFVKANTFVVLSSIGNPTIA